MSSKFDQENRTRAALVAAYIFSGISVRGLLRSLFDDIAGFQGGNAFLSPRAQKPLWYNWGDLRKKSRRKHLLNDFPAISIEAFRLLSEAPKSDLKPRPKMLVCDHVIPLRVLESLLGKEHERSRNLTADDVIKFHNRFYRRCIITTTEDQRIRSKRLSNEMPQKWKEDANDLYVRYSECGIELNRKY